MSYLSREVGPALVPAFASRVLLAMTYGVVSSDRVLRVLANESLSDAWPLCYVLVRWYGNSMTGPAHKQIVGDLDHIPFTILISQLEVYSKTLRPFAQAAYEANSDSDLRKAGSRFIDVVEQAGLRTFALVFKADIMDTIRAQIPGIPQPLKEAVVRIQNQAVEKLRAMPPKSRLENYDFRDFGARGALVKPATLESKDDRLSFLYDLTSNEVAEAHLRSIGWDQEAITRIMAGRNKKGT
jgi:hypothetical protein